jgi:hypothetical protein
LLVISHGNNGLQLVTGEATVDSEDQARYWSRLMLFGRP